MILSALALAATLASNPPIDLSQAEQMAASPDGKTIAWTSSREGSAALVIVAAGEAKPRTMTWSAEEEEAILDGGVVTSLEWSADGRYLAVELATSEGDGAIAIVDATARGPLHAVNIDGDTNFAVPHWAASGHVLFLAHGEGDENDDAGGLIRYDVDSRHSTRFLQHYWINAYTVSKSVVTALATDLDGDGQSATDRVIRYDLASGKAETVISRRSGADPNTKSLSL